MTSQDSAIVRVSGTTPRPLTPEDIQSEQPVVHPALDWRDGTLIMGIQLSGGGRGVLTSRREILVINQLIWPVCEASGSFSRSRISGSVASRLLSNYGATNNAENAYALVSVPNQLSAYYRRFIVFPEPWWPDVLALWTLGTYLYPIFSAYPYLRISSPEPGCGKSLLGQIVANLAFNGELMASPTEANIFRLAESERGTQVWDEVENENRSEQSRLAVMKAVLLNGYRAGASVPRQEGTSDGQFRAVRYHVYVPRVLIGLSELPPVVQQRTLELTLQRMGLADNIEQYLPEERAAEEVALRELCALYALSYCGAVASCYRNRSLVQRLRYHIGHAGRLSDDLLLPLVAVGVAPRDGNTRSNSVLDPLLRRIITEAAPALSRRWSEGAATTPSWVPEALGALKFLTEPRPADIAEIVRTRTEFDLSPEQIAHQLRRYGLRTVKRNGRRVYAVSAGQIEELQGRYGYPRGEETQHAAAEVAEHGSAEE